jgi:hypothetical protein
MIGRAAYLIGTPLWEGTVVDEWHDERRVDVMDMTDEPPAVPR